MDDFVLNISTGVPNEKKTLNTATNDFASIRKSRAPKQVTVTKRTTPVSGYIRGRPLKRSNSQRTTNVNESNVSSSQLAPRQSKRSNPLQFSNDKKEAIMIDKKNASVSTDVEKLMETPVEPRIEAVFSHQYWKQFCETFAIHRYITSCLTDHFKLTKLTAIQATAIPNLLQGKDCLIRAQTGSGKTLAYALPMIQRLISIEPTVTRANGTLALIILPTRELALQTFEVVQLLCRACVRIVPGCLVGGFTRKPQKESLRKGLNIVIGTPQRILDHMYRTSSWTLDKLRCLVIDEADRLMELGFEKDVRQIVDRINRLPDSETGELENQGPPVRRQTVLLSATLSKGVDLLAGLALQDPVHCEANGRGMGGDTSAESATDRSDQLEKSQFAMPAGLRHFLLIVPWKMRLTALAAFLLLKCKYHKNGGKLIVFMATQDCVEFHNQLFQTALCPSGGATDVLPAHLANLSLFRLHGNMEHAERSRVFKEFSHSSSGILLTTDVASRGLDLASVAWVVQYHATGSPVDYVHRVGRTARAGGRGKAVLFLSPEEEGFTDLLQARCGINLEPMNLTDLMQTALHHMSSIKRSRSFTVEEATSRFSFLLMDTVTDDPLLAPLAESAYTSFIRSYASYSKEMRQYFAFHRLHLGHVARAFCLQATPKEVASRMANRSSEPKEPHRQTNSRVPRSKHDSNANENEHSMDGAPARKRKRRAEEGKARQNMLAEYGL